MYGIGWIAGALIGTFLLSRLLLWLLKSWANGGFPKLTAAHALSLLSGGLLNGWTMSEMDNLTVRLPSPPLPPIPCRNSFG